MPLLITGYVFPSLDRPLLDGGQRNEATEILDVLSSVQYLLVSKRIEFMFYSNIWYVFISGSYGYHAGI